MNFNLWPWEHGEKPYLVNEKGFHWYFDKSTTEACYRETAAELPPLEAVAFIVAEKEDEKIVPITRILIDKKTNEILAEETNLEKLFYTIDAFRIKLQFE